MRTLVPILVMTVLAGFCSQANAQTQCPELSRLRGEAVEASTQKERPLVSNLCEAYIRSSLLWAEIVQYANEHRESCDISVQSLSDFEKFHREAVRARNNACSGRPVRSFPAEIIRR
ncbi:MAG: hypothetical protein ACREEK_16365 [Bradyrhizobium sp.]